MNDNSLLDYIKKRLMMNHFREEIDCCKSFDDFMFVVDYSWQWSDLKLREDLLPDFEKIWIEFFIGKFWPDNTKQLEDKTDEHIQRSNENVSGILHSRKKPF